MTTEPENCRINYIELNVRDIDKAKTFYGKAFGWTFTDYGALKQSIFLYLHHTRHQAKSMVWHKLTTSQ